MSAVAVLCALMLPVSAGCDGSEASDAAAGGGGSSSSGQGGEAGGPLVEGCIGPEPTLASMTATPAPKFVSWDLLPAAPKEPGSPIPIYQLQDFQPQSCSNRATYGLEQFRGKVTVAALLAGW